jgi:hypothetical protein
MTITLKLHSFQKQFLKLQVIIISSLLSFSFIGYISRHFSGSSFGLSHFFVDNEMTVTTWYSSGLLLLCAILLSTIAFVQAKSCKPYLRHWQLLAFIFLYLSLDESIAIHEKWGEPLKSMFKTGGFLHHAWLIPAVVLVSVLIMSYWRFLAQLHLKTRLLFKLGGMIYITGAIGFEMISGMVIKFGGTMGFFYILCTHFGEGLELMGLSIFLYGLLNYLCFTLKNVMILFKEGI